MLNLGNRFQTLEGNKVSWAVEVIGAGALRWPYLNYYSYGSNFTCMDDTLCNTGALDDFDTGEVSMFWLDKVFRAGEL